MEIQRGIITTFPCGRRGTSCRRYLPLIFAWCGRGECWEGLGLGSGVEFGGLGGRGLGVLADLGLGLNLCLPEGDGGCASGWFKDIGDTDLLGDASLCVRPRLRSGGDTDLRLGVGGVDLEWWRKGGDTERLTVEGEWSRSCGDTERLGDGGYWL